MNKIIKVIKVIKVIIFILVLNLVSFKAVFAEAPMSVKISAAGKTIGKVYYDGYLIENEKIESELGIGYCLEIQKDYPYGEEYVINGERSAKLNLILANGYPKVTVAELGLKSDDEAYTATQIALWSILEGYDVYKIKSDNEALLKAITKIYEASKQINKSVEDINYKVYYSNDRLQKIVLLIKDQVPEVEVKPEAPIMPEQDIIPGGK